MAETRTFNQPIAITGRLTQGGGVVRSNPTLYPLDGALTILPGLAKITKATAAAMTLAAPTAAQEGIVMTIYNDTAAAHTVTAAGGLGGGGAASDVATWSATIKGSLTVMAVNLHWTVLGSSNVTIA